MENHRGRQLKISMSGQEIPAFSLCSGKKGESVQYLTPTRDFLRSAPWRFIFYDTPRLGLGTVRLGLCSGCPACDKHPSRALVRRPADDEENARLIVSRIVLDALKDLKMAYPQ